MSDYEEDEDVCWCCFDAKHESGQPLRRDCSCRGGSGWVHLPCLVGYAGEWSKRNLQSRKVLSVRPWRICPNCKKRFQGDLAIDLANELMSFIDRWFPGDEWGRLVGLKHRLSVLLYLNSTRKIREEAKRAANSILSMLEKMKACGLPMPREEMLQNEAFVYRRLGCLYMKDERKESTVKAMGYFERYHDIGVELDSTRQVLFAETYISRLKAKYYGGSHAEVLEKCRRCYDLFVDRCGEESLDTIGTGISLSKALRNANHGIESERLLRKLVATSNQAHGSEHSYTKNAEAELRLQRVRVVKIKFRSENFRALRYEEDGTKCVVQGPISEERKVLDERVFAVDAKDIRPATGTPVMCQGLKRSSHLNGKVGDLRSYYKKTSCYEVRFEESGLQPRPLKMEFMQIVFDLP